MGSADGKHSGFRVLDYIPLVSVHTSSLLAEAASLEVRVG